ncbi:MAG: hypothetical protein CMP11_06525 [Zetaproteobacteria bacterium]|nr:hypothetical protein [Pseudobdellovibrionaceae bacterium]
MLKRTSKSIAFLAVFSCMTIVFALILLKKRVYFFLIGKKFTSHEAHEIATQWGKSLFKAIPGWKIKFKGLENLAKAPKPSIYIANHESATDILAIYLLDFQFRWLAKKEIFAFPLIGKAMKMSGYIPIKREDKKSRQDAIKKCELSLENKVSVLFFPEGTRSSLGYPKKFKLGAFKLSKEKNYPIVPIALKGAGGLLKKSSLSPSKATVKISVLPAIYPHNYSSLETYTQAAHDMICDEHKKL